LTEDILAGTNFWQKTNKRPN